MRIVYGGRASPPLTNLAELFRAIGLNVDMTDVVDRPITRESIVDLTGNGLVFDVASLSQVAGTAEAVRKCIEVGSARAVLLFTTDSAESTCQFLSEVTDGQVEGSARLTSGEECCFEAAILPAARVLAGTCFERAPKPALHLVGNGVDQIVCIGGEPTFASVPETAGSMLFVWSSLDVFDVTQRLSAELPFEKAVDEYVPGIIFARTVAGQATWHNPVATASLLIDDPLLRVCYGHIDFRELLASARTHGYTVSLAFIPWNHWRTRRRHVALFEHYRDVFSICVHGNNHTTAEFDSGDYEALRYCADQAIERMDMHRERTGIDYLPIMVCPQERYSVQALRAIAASGRYMAIANSRLIPNVSEAKGCVTAAELLQPAMDAWSPCSLLKRHYPAEGMGRFAIELFLGRPVVISEHHEYFSTGTNRIEEFVRELRCLSPDLAWRHPDEIVRTLRWQRQIDVDTWQVRLFADEYVLEPVAEGMINYQMERRVQDASVVTSVSADGRELDFTQNNDYVRFNIQASGPVTVRVNRRVPDADCVPVERYGKNAKVAFRRVVSEIRDRVLARGVLAATLTRPLRRTVGRQRK